VLERLDVFDIEAGDGSYSAAECRVRPRATMLTTGQMYLRVFSKEQLDALAYLFLDAARHA